MQMSNKSAGRGRTAYDEERAHCRGTDAPTCANRCSIYAESANLLSGIPPYWICFISCYQMTDLVESGKVPTCTVPRAIL